jgi:hypothetical protein
VSGLPWRPVVAAVVLGTGAGVIGLRPLDAALVGLVVLVIGLAWTALPAGQEYEWPRATVDEAAGSRREISALTWSFVGRDGRVAEPAVRRLRLVAARRLARRGVVVPGGISHLSRVPAFGSPDGAQEPDGAAHDEAARRARELLGDRAWATLTGPGGWLPSLADVAQCVLAIEHLGAPSDAALFRAPSRPPSRPSGRATRHGPRAVDSRPIERHSP